MKEFVGLSRIREGFHQLSSSIPNGGVIIFDHNFRYLMVEGEGKKRLGFPDSNISGKVVYDLFPLSDAHKIATLQRKTLSGVSSTEEYSNEVGDFSFLLKPLQDANGFVDVGMLFFQEITELKQTQKALEQKLLEQDRLTMAVYHDLATPIRSIVSFAQLLEKRKSEQLDIEGINFLNHIIRGGIRLEVMVKGLLSYLQLNENPISENLDLYQVVANVIIELYDTTGEKKLDIQYHNLPVIQGDFMEFKMLFGNLVKNAISYNVDDEVSIQIEASRTGSSWVFAVKDNGVGIYPEHQKVIFSLFNHGHPQYRHLGGGFGLPICKKIVEKRGGRIWIDSEPDKGSVIFFTVPDEIPGIG